MAPLLALDAAASLLTDTLHERGHREPASRTLHTRRRARRLLQRHSALRNSATPPWTACRCNVSAAVRLSSAGALDRALRVHAPPDWSPSGWPPELAAMLARGVVRRGNPDRLLRAMRAARRGEPVVVVGVGSSLAGINGGAVGAWQDRFSNLTYIDPLHRVTGDVFVPGWLLPIFDAIAPHRHRHPNSTLVNVAQPGSPLGVYRTCTRQLVPPRADVIVVDAAVIDEQRSNLENVLRRLLALQGAPAVILANFVRWCDPEVGPCDARCQRMPQHVRLNSNRKMAANGSCYQQPYLNSSLARAARREAPLNELADHYDLPVLSARAAFSDAVARGLAGFDPRKLTSDSLHPLLCTLDDLERGGHGACRGSLLLSSLVVSYVHSVFDAARSPHAHDGGGGGASARPLPPLLWQPPRKQRRGDEIDQACFAWGASRAKPPPVVATEGFRYTETDTATEWEAAPGPARRPKPGFTAFAPGSRLKLRLDTRGLCAADERGRCTVAPARKLSLNLMYLSSYSAMGQGAVTCDGGCSCERTEFDAYRGAEASQRDVSLWQEVAVGSVVMRPSAESCDIAVAVLNTTRSGGHKVKLRGVTLSAWPVLVE